MNSPAAGTTTSKAELSEEELAAIASLQRRRRIRRELIGWGAGVGGIGVVAVATTGAAYFAFDEMKPAAWTATVAVNTTGWVFFGLGAALLGSGLLIRKTPRQQRVTVLPQPKGVAAMGWF